MSDSKNLNVYTEPPNDIGAVTAKITVAIMAATVLVVGALLLVLDRPEISDSEKRDLATMPTFSVQKYVDGSFFNDFSFYFTDTVPYRESLIKTSTALNSLTGIQYMTFYGGTSVLGTNDYEQDFNIQVSTAPPTAQEPAKLLYMPMPYQPNATTDNDDAAENENYTQPAVAAIGPMPYQQNINDSDDKQGDQTTEAEADETQPDELHEEQDDAQDNLQNQEAEAQQPQGEILDIAQFSNNGIVVDGVEMYGEIAGVMLFGGSASAGQYYANVLNAYRQALGDEVNIYNLLIPTSAEFYLPNRFSRYSSSQQDSINYIYSLLDDGITTIDAYSAIKAHSDEYIYARTDHHWMQLGAYYAYTAFSETLGQAYPALSEYEHRQKDGFIGSLYHYTNDSRLLTAPETFVYYMPPNVDYVVRQLNYNTLAYMYDNQLYHEYASGGNMYGMFLGGDALHLKIETSVANGKSIVVFKESFGNAFIPFLVNNYETVYVIDIRYFGPSAIDYIKDEQINDVLFLNNIFAANTHSLISCIDNLRW